MDVSQDALLLAYRQYETEKEERIKLNEKLELMEHRYLNLTHAFNLHLDICKTHRDMENESEWSLKETT